MTKLEDRREGEVCEGCFGMSWIPELDRRFILCSNPRSDHYGHVLDIRHSCQEFAIEAPADLGIIRDQVAITSFESIEALVKWSHNEAEKYRGRIVGFPQPGRVVNAIARLQTYAFQQGRTIEDLTDREMLYQRAVGPRILAEIRQLIPGPGKGEENVEKGNS